MAKRQAIDRHSHGLVFELLEQRRLLAAAPVITEFMASNGATLDDGDGNSSDWVEIYNAADQAVDIAGRPRWRRSDGHESY